MLSRRVNRLWKNRGNSFRSKRPAGGRSESSSEYKKRPQKEVTCFECKEPGHYKNECPKLNKDAPKKKFFNKKKKALMASWDDSDASEQESDEEIANVALMAINEESSSSSDSETEEVFSHLSRSELQLILEETFEKNLRLQKKLKEFKKGTKGHKRKFSEADHFPF